ncbi:TlpA family protein disulfide reductase [Aeoliella sp.]|uniref:TlpA family protein disulfide reductase n=1 Tax=Aeoliella sp. TaxID=2795800 RepID=UPI003CCB85FE
MRWTALVLVSCFTAVGGILVGAPCHAEPITAEQALATHRENLEKLRSLHLQATITTEWTEAFRENHRQEAEAVGQLIEKLESGEVDLNDVSPQLKTIGYTVPMFIATLKDKLETNRALQDNDRVENVVEIFARGPEYQVRMPYGERGEYWRFPKSALTPKSLVTDFTKMHIFTYSNQLDPAGQVWGGLWADGSPKPVQLRKGHYRDFSVMMLPPYAFTEQYPCQARHPIEEFFKAPEQEFIVVREETVGDRRLVVLDALVPYDYQSSKTNEQGETITFQAFDFYRARLDLSRGGVVTELKWWYGFEGMDREKQAATTPKGTVVASKIRRLTSSGYFPTVTVVETYGADYSTDKEAPTKYSVHDRKTWECTMVESPVELPENFFQPEYPVGQTYYDAETEKIVGALEPKPSVKAGTVAPPLENLHWLDGGEHSLEEFRGNVVVLEFWRLRSRSSRDMTPALKEVQQLYDGQPVTFIAIHTAEADTEQTTEAIEQFASDQGWDYLQAIDAGTMQYNSQVANAYGVSSYPTHIVIGPDGRVVYNSDVPPPGLEDIIGKPCEDATPEDEQRLQAYMLAEFTAANIDWSEDEELSQEEQIRRFNKLLVYQLKKQIDSALSNVKAE